MRPTQPSVSLILPAYNESKRIEETLRKLIQFSADWASDHEILVVIEKSADDTLAIARRIARSHPRIQIIDNVVHRGKGYAVRSGVLRATKDLVFFTDLDLSTPLAEIDPFVEYFARHPRIDVLIGCRRHPKAKIEKRQNLIRQTMGRIFNLFVRPLALGKIKDTQCGFKAFRRDPAHSIFARQKILGFAFDVEILFLARRLGHAIEVRPVRWINSPDSKVSIVRDSLRMLRDLILIPRVASATLREIPAGTLPADAAAKAKMGVKSGGSLRPGA